MSGETKPGRIAVVAVLALLLCALPAVLATRWEAQAAARLVEAEAAPEDESEAVAIAAEADEEYCTPALRQILRRVLASCGLGGSARGCQPVEARNVATMDDADFNALFVPMRERGGIVQFDRSSSDLDGGDTALVDRIWADRGGASYFFVVARASPDGSATTNAELSHSRADNVMAHLRAAFDSEALDQQVGLLWLGEEFAQLDPSFCEWERSGEAGACAPEDLNRSAFVAWIDCRL